MKGMKGSTLTGSLLLWGTLLAAFSPIAAAERYRFRVFLDEKEIGRQTFDVTVDGGETRVDIEASFDVKILFLTVYSYRHVNEETWEDGCLRSIASRTEDGGKEFFVEGRYDGGVLHVRTVEGDREVEGCVSTYPYWDPSLLRGKRLLNSQTGSLDRVEILELGPETIPVGGIPTTVEHRRIVGENAAIDLWHTPGGEWVALESTASNGGRIRYVIE